jgi:5-methylcytosine-specific restriction endonuclease McrA
MLNSPVLVLNRSYLPIHVTSVRRAVSLLYQGIARVVDGEYRSFDFEQWSRLRVVHEAASVQTIPGTDRGTASVPTPARLVALPAPRGEGREGVSREPRDWIGTSRGPLRMPRVIVLTVFDRVPRRHVRFSRANVMSRDGFMCQYCGERPPRSQLNLDHVVPRAHGGRSTWENVVASCLDCNRRKGGRTPEQAGLRLLRSPARPRWSPLASLPLPHVRHAEWRPFLHVVDTPPPAREALR